MDPNKLLKEIRSIVADLIKRADEGGLTDHEYDLAEKFDNLDEWLTRGGFQPREWENVHLVQLEIEMKSYFKYTKADEENAKVYLKDPDES